MDKKQRANIEKELLRVQKQEDKLRKTASQKKDGGRCAGRRCQSGVLPESDEVCTAEIPEAVFEKVDGREPVRVGKGGKNIRYHDCLQKLRGGMTCVIPPLF